MQCTTQNKAENKELTFFVVSDITNPKMKSKGQLKPYGEWCVYSLMIMQEERTKFLQWLIMKHMNKIGDDENGLDRKNECGNYPH